ncbi:MAG: energy-coupling factor transporter ATPase [Eubacterium sp.]|nr:energy-coupling factor transporter ATPase [Eubacterium sp.]
MSIQVRNIRYVYNEGLPDETVALDNVSFDLFDGEIVSVIGHTGSGKSTMLQQLNGLLRPSEGTIVVEGTEITRPTAVLRDVRRNVGLVFQYPEYQLFEETIEKDVAFGPRNIGVPEDQIEDRVRRSLELVDLDFDEIRERSPFDLSGGQKRRAAIAGVLAMEPHVLVLDEPTAGLDPEAHGDIIAMIRRIHEERNGIIVFVSHNMMDVALLSDRIIVMDRGRVITVDTPRNVFANRAILRSIGLDVPPAAAFLCALKERGAEVNTDVLTYDEAADEILKCFGYKEREGGEEQC